MDKLSSEEIMAFQKLVFDSDSKPYFDPMRYCLRWKDEEPEAVSRAIYKKLHTQGKAKRGVVFY